MITKNGMKVVGYGIADSDNATLDIIPVSTQTNMYFYLQTVQVSVFKAGDGEEPICTIQDTEGTALYKFSVSGVKDFTINFGEMGVTTEKNKGIQMVVSGGSIQGSVSAIAEGYLNPFDEEGH